MSEIPLWAIPYDHHRHRAACHRGKRAPRTSRGTRTTRRAASSCRSPRRPTRSRTRTWSSFGFRASGFGWCATRRIQRSRSMCRLSVGLRELSFTNTADPKQKSNLATRRIQKSNLAKSCATRRIQRSRSMYRLSVWLRVHPFSAEEGGVSVKQLYYGSVKSLRSSDTGKYPV